MPSRFLSVVRAALVVAVVHVHCAACQAGINEAHNRSPSRLVSIVDYDSRGRVTLIRIGMKFDRQGRRIANDVLDDQEKQIAHERFQYDEQGRLVRRSYVIHRGALKWTWHSVRHNADGAPIRNNIVNAKGRKIGSYVWHYENRKLTRRDRYNADRSLRFYYADIKRDATGNDVEWTKFDANGHKIGSKRWTYADR